MSYQVIARKYRPQRFADVVGQEHVTQTLSNAIQQQRIAHAYLFVGPRGTGKTTLARIFAKCLNSTNGPKVDFPDDDPKAREITEGRSLDVLEIDGASNRGIEEIRELRETVKYAPASSRFKIYIIDEVHMLTKEAFNALLKTLEEPPEHVKFMFATTEPEKVLPTILSRCQRFDLRRIPTSLIVKHLAHIAKLENVEVEQAALLAIARGADGGMRDAESTLDQLISFCGARIVEADVLSMFGLAAQSQIISLVGAIVRGEIENALRELNDLSKGGKDLTRLLSELLAAFRNLLLFQISSGDPSLLDISETEMAVLAETASQIDADALTRILDVLTDCEARLRDAASRKIMMEVTLLKAIQARHAVPIDFVLKKLQALRAETPSEHSPKTSVPPPASSAAPQKTPRAATSASASKPAKAPDPEPTPAPASTPILAPGPSPEPQAQSATAPVPAPAAFSDLATLPQAPAIAAEPAQPPPAPTPSEPAPPPPAPRQRKPASPAPTAPGSNSELLPEFTLAPTDPTPPPVPEVPLTEPPPARGTSPAPDLPELWAQVLDAVGRANPFLKSYLLEAHPVSLTKTIFTIGFDPEFADHIALVDNSKNRTIIQTKLKEMDLGERTIRFVKADAPANWSRPASPAPSPEPEPAAPKPSEKPKGRSQSQKRPATSAGEAKPQTAVPLTLNQEDFKNDPLIRQALEIFKGTIVEVRS